MSYMQALVKNQVCFDKEGKVEWRGKKEEAEIRY